VTREFSWKPWAHDEPYVNRERIIEELVDVVHFIGNMLVNIDCSDAEWEDKYQRKQRTNRRRQVVGYSARKEQA
jgi:dimeric dUTPase (all-alpha-NTP-PPase superfamily)